MAKPKMPNKELDDLLRKLVANEDNTLPSTIVSYRELILELFRSHLEPLLEKEEWAVYKGVVNFNDETNQHIKVRNALKQKIKENLNLLDKGEGAK